MSVRPESHPFMICPFCNGLPAELAVAYPDRETIEAQAALQKHIARHLQSLALLSLTWLDDAKSTALSEKDRILDLEDCLEPLVFRDPLSHEVPTMDIYVDEDWGGILPAVNDIADDGAWTEWSSKGYNHTWRGEEWDFCKEISLPHYNGHLNDDTLTAFVKRFMESKARDNSHLSSEYSFLSRFIH
jgi:hypothetical protein